MSLNAAPASPLLTFGLNWTVRLREAMPPEHEPVAAPREFATHQDGRGPSGDPARRIPGFGQRLAGQPHTKNRENEPKEKSLAAIHSRGRPVKPRFGIQDQTLTRNRENEPNGEKSKIEPNAGASVGSVLRIHPEDQQLYLEIRKRTQRGRPSEIGASPAALKVRFLTPLTPPGESGSRVIQDGGAAHG